MKTDDLIAALAVDLPPASPRHLERMLLFWMIPAGILVLAGVMFWLGLRGDLIQAVTGPTFWSKAAYSTALAVAGFWLLDRLGRPGASVRAPALLLGAVLLVVAVLAVAEQIAMPAADRM